MYTVDDSILRVVEIDVKPVRRVKYLTKSVKFITNQQQPDDTTQLVPFQIDSNLRPGQASLMHSHNQQANCSERFESFLHARQQSKSASQSLGDLIPFKCTASLFTKSGHRLAYLDRLLITNVNYVNQHWSCEVRFAPNSNSLLYTLIDSNIDRNLAVNAKSNEAFSDENEPTLIKLTVNTKSDEFSPYDEPADEELTGQVPFVPAFYVQTKQIELPIVRSSIRKDKEGSSVGGDHFNLIIQATHQIQSHLILTTNCPSLVKINPLLVTTSDTPSVNSLFTVTYDVVTSDEMFDLTTYSNLMQQHQGQLYVQVSCSLTQQVERIPIKFLFGMGDMSHVLDYKPSAHSSHRSSFFYSVFGKFLLLKHCLKQSLLIML